MNAKPSDCRLQRLGDLGWHPLDDAGDEDITERFEKLPILVQRALMRLAYTVIDSSPQETAEADTILDGLTRAGSPVPDAPMQQLRALQGVRGAVAAQVIINKYAPQETGE